MVPQIDRPVSHGVPVDLSEIDSEDRAWSWTVPYVDSASARQWEVTVVVAERSGAVQLRRVELESRDGSSITSPAIRNFPWGEVFAIVRADFAEAFEEWGLRPTASERMQAAAERLAGQLRGRGRRVTEEQLMAVADTYRSAVGNPTEAVAQTLGLTRSTAGKWVAKAREAGFLGSTTHGKAGEITSAEGDTT